MGSSNNDSNIASFVLHGAVHRYLGGGDNDDGNDNNNSNDNSNDNGNNNNGNGNNNGNNNNNNGNYNNNNNNNYNNGSSYNEQYTTTGFNVWLFTGTALFCMIMFLYILLRIKYHRRRTNNENRIKLGGGSGGSSGGSRGSNSNTKTSSSSSSSNKKRQQISDEEIYKYVLPIKKENSYNEAFYIIKNDIETKRILKLCKPFWFDALIASICDIISASLIGRGLGVDALAIYYIVGVPTTFTLTLIESILSTISTLGGQSIGVGSYKLTGQYCQISIVLYTILYIPHAILWIIYLKPTLRWFAPNLNDDIIEEGYKYFLVSLVYSYVEAFSTVIHSLLEVTDHAGYGMKSGVAHNIISVIGFFLYLEYNRYHNVSSSLVIVNIIWTILVIVFLIIDLLVIKKKKWFDDFWKGMLRSVAMKYWNVVWLVLKTAAPISVGNVLLTVEWELLAIFAATLGGNQVAAWGIVGSIWGVLEYATDCVAAAGEIRVAKLLGNGNPRLAKLSAYKCLFLGNAFATVMSVVFVIGIPFLPSIFTDDDELKQNVAMVLPYCAIGNLTLTLGSLSWTLVGAQGRYNVATFHGCVGSLFVTIPCACVSIFYFKWGLPSLAASVVIGYMVSGAFNSVTLLLSDWEYISYRVMIRNGATEPVEDDEDDDEDSDVDVGNVGNDAGVNKRWNLLQYMRGGNNNNETYNDDEKNVSFISVKSNQKKYADADADDADDADDDGSTGTNNTVTSGVIKKSSSRWLTFGRDHEENELRRVVLGPGKLGYTIQSTKNGPMVVRSSDEYSNLDGTAAVAARQNKGGVSYRGYQAKNLTGQLFNGDIIVEIDKTRCDKMSGKDVKKLLITKSKQRRRTLIVSHREGTDLGAVYQPGIYGAAVLAALLKTKGNDVDDERGTEKEFDDDGVHIYGGTSYSNMSNLGWFA